MTLAQLCPECGVALPENSPEGLCPQCLLKDALKSGPETPAKSWSVSTTPYQGAVAAPTPEELALHFPQLEVLELLGQGGMGAVYKARQPKLDRLVALKILPPEVDREPAFAERFLREARALARLSHPHIVGVYDFGETAGLFYFLMEYVDGGNLRHRLSAGRVAPGEVGRIVAQVGEALQYAHDEGVIHRDIKPENILVDRKGQVKIADFGLARLVVRTPAYFSLTGSRQVVGTPYYMAPEQMEKPQEVDHRVDVYSLGVVLYELLTGKLPVGSFAPPSQEAGIDPRFDAVVVRALARELGQRYQHIREIAADLNAIAPLSCPARRPEPVSGRPEELPAAPSSRPRVSALRFKAPVVGYFFSVPGILRLEEDALRLEYLDHALNQTGWQTTERETRIPLGVIADIRVEKYRWWNPSRPGYTWGNELACLVITASSLTALKPFIDYRTGSVRLYLRRGELASAEQLVAVVRQRLGLDPGGGRPGGSPPLREPPQPRGARAEGPLVGKLKSLVRSVCSLFASGPGQSTSRVEPPPEPSLRTGGARGWSVDKRRLVFGLAVLLLVAGALLACWAPGGLLNHSNVSSIETPFGVFSATETKSSPWPVVGYVFLGLAGLAGVVGFALKAPRE